MYWTLAKEISLKYISIFSSGGHVFHIIILNLDQEEMSFKNISNLEL